MTAIRAPGGLELPEDVMAATLDAAPLPAIYGTRAAR